jgi:hypothetical protein
MPRKTRRTDNQQEGESKESQNTEIINAEQVEKELPEETEEYEKEKTDQEIILDIDPDELEPHDKNTEIYGPEPVDLELLKSIKENGQLDPVVITRDSIKKKLSIISGHRRWKAIKMINEENEENEEEKIPIKYIYRSYKTDSQVTKAIIEYNRQRKKVASQIYQEAISLDKILSPQAKERQKRISDVPDLAQQNKEKNGRTIEQEADTLGMGKETLRKLKFIGGVCFQDNPKYEKYKNIQDNAEDILKELNKGKISIDAAYNKLKLICISSQNQPMSQYAGKLVNKISDGEKILDNSWEMFKKYENSGITDIPQDNHSVQLNNDVNDNDNLLDSYSVVVTDLTKFTVKEARKSKFTDSKKAALFLWADTFNIRERINLLEKCNFTLKAIGIWKNETFLGTYFEGKVEFLLLGIRGNIVNSDFKPHIILNNENCENKSAIYEIAEKMFPNETYVDLDKDPKRKGWDGLYCEENITSLEQPIKNDEVIELV